MQRNENHFFFYFHSWTQHSCITLYFLCHLFSNRNRKRPKVDVLHFIPSILMYFLLGSKHRANYSFATYHTQLYLSVISFQKCLKLLPYCCEDNLSESNPISKNKQEHDLRPLSSFFKRVCVTIKYEYLIYVAICGDY